MKDLKTTNTLLLIIVIPLILYILKILSFIFVPLIFSIFIAMLFLPLLRWLRKRKVHKAVGILLSVGIIIGFICLGFQVLKLANKEILNADEVFLQKAETKIVDLVETFEAILGIERLEGTSVVEHYFKENNLLKNVGATFSFFRSLIVGALMTLFFAVLLLSESINFHDILSNTIFNKRISSIKALLKIENNITKFIWVKFLMSLFTGIGFMLACMFFDVSFPIFWGLFAFLINFVQMVGSVISVILLSLFAFIEIDPINTLLLFMLVITLVQVLFGAILEPILMGKTLSINIITVLVMLMFWGFLWGVPGLILSIPITAVIKIFLEQFESSNKLVKLLFGSKES